MGYCEFSTGVEREMATVDADRPPPEGLVKKAGYQVQLKGNVSFGDFTNRLKFEGGIEFANSRQWRELNFRLSSRQVAVEVRSQATNQTVYFKVSSADGQVERELTFEELRDPAAVLRAFAGNFADALSGLFDLPDVSALAGTQGLDWSANRTRVKIGSEYMPVYRLETSFLGRPVKIDVSTIGEVLRVSLPGDITAQIDEWSRP
jgi:hypothetical protein